MWKKDVYSAKCSHIVQGELGSNLAEPGDVPLAPTPLPMYEPPLSEIHVRRDMSLSVYLAHWSAVLNGTYEQDKCPGLGDGGAAERIARVLAGKARAACETVPNRSRETREMPASLATAGRT